MEEFITVLVEGIMDAFEEFFDALTVPTTKFTFQAFLVSLCFLGLSVAGAVFGLPVFVDWQEALACSILMLIVVLIDSSARSGIKSNLGKLRGVASKFTYNGEEALESVSDEEEQEFEETEVVNNGTEYE